MLGLIGAIVGEFIASTRGLGYLIQNAATNLDLGTVFAAVLSASCHRYHRHANPALAARPHRVLGSCPRLDPGEN